MKNKTYKKSLVWIRRDLRLLDHSALSHATKDSRNVGVVFVFDKEIIKNLRNKADQRITFIYDSLQEVDEKLRKHGSKLIVLFGNPIVEIPKLIEGLGFEALYFNEDYEAYAIKRDKIVQETLSKKKISSYKFKDHIIFSAGEVLKPNNTAYQMFTPYKKTWLKKLSQKDYEIQKVTKNFISLSRSVPDLKKYDLKKLGFKRAEFFYDFQYPGRKNAIKHIKRFSEHILNYKNNRDYPSVHGTSGLSVHLRFGTLSTRECLRLSLKSDSLGHQTWLSEIIWRDFYQMILAKFPHIEKKSFKNKYDDIKWVGTTNNFKAWCEGKTGYPIVDAAMRQLNETGWMHNRLRMIVASFLTKDLLIDWRKGEAYFAEKLLDFDLASNNGGWQWSASTGCDAQPYFRIFNPELQSKRFDPNGNFLRLWLPELADCSNKEIHCPVDVEGYPKPIVDHKVQKSLAIEMFKAAK